MIQAPGAAGMTVRSRPSGTTPPNSRSNRSHEAAAGQLPSPSMVMTRSSAAR
ncbi:Uncharacterised protein [Bordetella pertussis]|nr:Uncharacterised protein [Bordetella pertussis]CFP60407.1 Uncharacterised protein [Bordetella pertussis]